MLTVLTEWCFSSDVAVKIIFNSWKLCSQQITSNEHKLQHAFVLLLNRRFLFLSPVCEDHLVSGSFDPPASVCQSCILGLWLFPAGLSGAWRHYFRRQVRSLQHHQHRLPLLQPGMKPAQLQKIFWQNFFNLVLPSSLTRCHQSVLLVSVSKRICHFRARSPEVASHLRCTIHPTGLLRTGGTHF